MPQDRYYKRDGDDKMNSINRCFFDADQGRIALVPVRPMKSMRGFLKGIDTDVPRDADRT